MRSDRVLGTIDVHTAGIGMRLSTSRAGHRPGATIAGERRPAILPEVAGSACLTRSRQRLFDPVEPPRAGGPREA
jgi:hypothetical protein